VDQNLATHWSLVHHAGEPIETAIFELKPQRTNRHETLVVTLATGNPELNMDSRLGRFRLSFALELDAEVEDLSHRAMKILEAIAARRPNTSRVLKRLAEQSRYVIPPDTSSALAFASAAIAAAPIDPSAVELLTEVVLDTDPQPDSTWYLRLLDHIARLPNPVDQARLQEQIAAHLCETADRVFATRVELARDYYLEAQRLAPATFDREIRLGERLLTSKAFIEAERTLQAGVQRAPLSAEHWSALSQFYESRQQDAKAIATLREGLGRAGKHRELRLRLARLLLRAREFSEGEVQLQQLADDGLLSDQTLGEVVMYLAADRQSESVQRWAHWWLDQQNLESAGPQPRLAHHEQSKTLGRVFFALAAVDCLDEFATWLVPQHPWHESLRKIILLKTDEALMQREFSTYEQIENPAVALQFIKKWNVASGADDALQSRQALLELVMDEEITAAINPKHGLSALVELLRETPRDQWAELPPSQLSSTTVAKADLDLAEWLWWEYRMTQQTSVRWDGWLRP
jgi:hypothetical protein